MSLEATLARMRAEAPRRHPTWDSNRFEAHVGAAHEMIIRGAPESVVHAYLELVADAAARPPSALRELLLSSTLTSATDVASIARVHNLAEGLERELPWLDGFVAHALAESELAQFEANLVATLEAVFDTTEGRWGRGTMCAMRTLRQVDDEILPGSLELVAPRVLRVRDRDDPSRGAGVVVLGRSDMHVTPLPDGNAIPAASEATKIGDQQMVVDGMTVFCDGLRAPLTSIASAAPFVAAIAEDSQHVWIASPR